MDEPAARPPEGGHAPSRSEGTQYQGSTTELFALPVCIIGAGSSGVTMAKALKEKGVAFECFEIGSDIGGMWRYENDNGLSSAYRSLHIDTSRKTWAISDFPIADHYPDFLSHVRGAGAPAGVCAEVRREAAHPLQHSCRRRPSRPPRRVAGRACRTARSVAIARSSSPTGICGTRAGLTFPAVSRAMRSIRTTIVRRDPFKDKHVLIVGIGNSAVDIAVDVCRQREEHDPVDPAQRLDHAEVHHGLPGGPLVRIHRHARSSFRLA